MVNSSLDKRRYIVTDKRKLYTTITIFLILVSTTLKEDPLMVVPK
jgi:hypothetical protein